MGKSQRSGISKVGSLFLIPPCPLWKIDHLAPAVLLLLLKLVPGKGAMRAKLVRGDWISTTIPENPWNNLFRKTKTLNKPINKKKPLKNQWKKHNFKNKTMKTNMNKSPWKKTPSNKKTSRKQSSEISLPSWVLPCHRSGKKCCQRKEFHLVPIKLAYAQWRVFP